MDAHPAMRKQLTDLAFQVAGLLNLVQDDDERELLQEHFETVLSDELYAGSHNRNVVRPLHDALTRLGLAPLAPPDANVVDIRDWSLKVQA